MQTAASIYYTAGGALAVLLLICGESPWWLSASVAGYLAMSTSISVGYHRLFTHGAFRTRRAWEVALALVGTMLWTGSPVQWRALHTTHHRFSDTARDPHVTSPDYIFWKRYRGVKLNILSIRTLMRDPFHRALHFWYALVPLSIMATLVIIDWRALVFGVFLPLSYFNVVATVHQVVAHAPNKFGRVAARDLPLMEFVLPFGGEWMHGHHHRNPRAWNGATRWWHLDYGAWFIRAVRTDA